MFLSNWLVFKIVLAAVTGLVDYPLAADVLLKYDNANKLYLDGNSIDYVSNVVLYKGETSYTLGMGDIINKTTTTAYEIALPSGAGYGAFGINQDATRYVHQYPESSGYSNGKFQVYSGTPSGGYTEYGSSITPFDGNEVMLCSMSADGKYILVTNYNGGFADGYKMYKDNGSEYVYHSSYACIGSSTNNDTGYTPAFVPSNNNFVITGTGGGSNSGDFYFKLYVYDPLTETWTGKTTVYSLNAPTGDAQRGLFGKSFTYDGKYLMMSDNGTPTRGEVYEVDWDANTMVNVWYTTEGSDGDGAGGAISPDNRYVVLARHTGNPYRVYENMSGDWTTVENVTSQFDLTGSGTSTSFGTYGIEFSGYSSENTTPLYIGQFAGYYGDGKFRLENWAKRSPYQVYITQPGTYRADLQICGIDYKTNEVEVTGTPSDIELYTEPETDFTANKAVLSSTSSVSYHQGGMSDNGEYYFYGQQVYKKDTGSFTYTTYGSALSSTIFNGSQSSISHDGNYIVSYYTNSTYQLHIIKNNGSTFTSHQIIASPNSSARSDSQPQFIPGPLKHFVWIEKVSGSSNITFHFYKYNSGTDTWSLGFSVTNPTDLTVGDSLYGRGGISFSKDGNYLAISASTADTSNKGVAVLKVDWVNETCVKKYENTSVGYWACFLSRDAKYFYYSTGTGTTAGKMLYSANGDWEGTPTDVTSSFTNIGNLGDHTSVFSGRYIFSEKGGSARYIFKWQDLISPTLTFDNYNKLSLTNTPTYTSSKLTYGSNVYDIGTLTSDITIEKQGEYASLTFDTSSNVAYFSNVTVGAIASTMAGYEVEQIINGFASTTVHFSSQGGFGGYIDFNGDGTRMVLGASTSFSSAQGRAYVYHLEDGSWVQKVDIPSPNTSYQRFGDSVLMNEDGTRIAVNQWTYDRIHIYEYTNGAWPTSPTTSITTSNNSGKGDMDWNKDGTVIVAGDGSENSTRKTYVYRLNGGTWTETNIGSVGHGVAINGAGTRVLIGANSVGKIYEANYDSGTSTWSSLTEVHTSSSSWPVRIRMDEDGTTAVAINGTNGQGRILERQSGTSWTSVMDVQGRCSFYGRGSGSISYDGTMVLTGDNYYNPGSVTAQGRAYLYQYSGGSWSLTKTYENPDASPATNDYWGYGTAMAKNTKDRLAIGMTGDDTAGADYGSVHIYTNAIPDFISFDTYNKLSLSGITKPTSKLHALPTGAESTTTYDIGTATNIYIESAGTYTVAMKGSSAFALDSTVVGTVTPLPTDYVKIPDIPVDIYTDSSYIRTTTSYTNSIGQTVYPGVKSSFTYNGGAYEISADSCADGNTEGANYQPWHVFTSILGDTTYSYYNTANYVNVPSWLKIKIPSAKVAVGFFLLENRNEHINGFKIQGSNNDSDWTDLYTGTTVGMTTGISPTFSNSTAYQYYRLYVTSLSSSGNNYWRIDDWNMHFFGYVAPPSLNFDGFNKYTFTGADTGSTYKLKYESNTYDLGTISNVYIAHPGTYSAEIKGATNFALSSNVATIQALPTRLQGSDISAMGTTNYTRYGVPSSQSIDVEDFLFNSSSNINPCIDFIHLTNSQDTFVFDLESVKTINKIRIYAGNTTPNWASRNTGSVVKLYNGSTLVYTSPSLTFSRSSPETYYGPYEEGKDYNTLLFTTGYTNIDKITVETPSTSAALGRVEVNDFTDTPSLTFDGYNKLTLSGLESGSTSNVLFNGNTYSIGTASNVYIENTGTYEAESKGTTTFALTSNVTGAISTQSTLAFHYGAFSLSDYSSAYSTVGAAATAGFVYSDTTPATYTWGTLNSVDTSTSGQTGYSWTPTTTMTADVLMVAGGGGGGSATAGGGGAGGLLHYTNQSLSGQKTIVVGNGGTGGLNGYGTDGSSTSFTSLTTAVGGGGGGKGGDGRSGGSGGGAGSANITSGGSGTSGQGNAGGSGYSYNYKYSGGGGGGAGGVGNNSSLNVGGDGGDGIDKSSTFGMSYGVSGWFAGGGGGAGYTNLITEKSSGGIGGGGGGIRDSDNPQNGQKHTGGGGGGALGDLIYGGSGGSGIVIIRPSAPPSLTHDGYKLVVSGITPTSTTLKYGSNTYEIGTATNIYVENTGDYSAEIGSAADFAFTNTTVSGTIKTIEPGFASRYQGSMALTYDGKLYAWGMNDDGEAGVGTSSDITVPTLCTGITQGTVAKLLSGSDLTDNSRGEVSYVKTIDGKIYATGKGDNFVIPGTTSDLTSFTDVTSYFGDQSLTANNVTMMSFTQLSGAALTETGNVWTWGTHDSTNKALGQAGASSSSTPKQINFSSVTGTITKVTCGSVHSLALDTSGDVWFWGKNTINSDSWPSSVTDEPQKVVDGKNIIGLASSYGTMYAWDATGKMWNAGNNWEGQIGDGTTTTNTTGKTLTEVTYFSSNGITINKVYGGGYFVFADTSDGYYCWGSGGHGVFGNGSTGNITSGPAKWTNVSNIKKFMASTNHATAITEDGKYYAWGNGTNNARGDNDTGDISYPKYISQLPNILAPSFEFDGYDKVLASGTFVYEFYVSVKASGGSGLHYININQMSSSTLTLQTSMVTVHVPSYSGSVANMFDGSNSTTYSINDPNHEVGTKILTLVTDKELADLTFVIDRPVYMPGWRITCNGETVLNDTANGGTSLTPSPATFTKTLSPITSLTKYTKGTTTYDAGKASIITVPDPGTYDAQLKKSGAFALKSATVPATKASGLYTWAFHHGNFDNAYGDGDILTARENGRFYADTPAYTSASIGTITPSPSLTPTYLFTISAGGTSNTWTWDGLDSSWPPPGGQNEGNLTYSSQLARWQAQDYAGSTYGESPGQFNPGISGVANYGPYDIQQTESYNSTYHITFTNNEWSITHGNFTWKITRLNGSMTTSNTTYTFTPASTLTANVLMVAGGGGGGGRYHAGGGGAGGLVYTAGTTLSGTKTIVVGNGDSGGNATGSPYDNGYKGKDTTFTDLDTAIGGGGGGANYTAGNDGGSGGGGGASQVSGTPNAGGSGTANQGNDGGVGIYINSSDRSGGGGGGAGGVGIPGVSGSVSGEGGIGKFFGTGSSFTNFGDEYGEGGYFAGGGGGGVYHSGRPQGIPGRGGGGYGATEYGYMGVGGSQHALPHTGGGGGGSGMGETTDQHPGYNSTGDGGVTGHGGRGGSGIVLIQTNVALPNGANTAVVQNGNPRRRSLPPAVSYMGSEVNRFYIIDSTSMPTYKLPTHWYVDPVGSNSNSVWTTQGSHSLQKRADGGTSNVFYVTSTEGIFEYGNKMAQSADAIFMPVEAQRYNGLLAIGSNSTNDIHFEMAADGTAALYYDNGATLLSAGTITCFTVGKWHHIALTVDSGGNAVGYVNGYPVVSGTHTSVAAVGSRSGNMHMRVGDHSITFRKFLTYEVSTYNFHMSPKQVLQRAAEVGLGPKLEYDGLNAINVVNTEPGSGTEITIYESNVNDTSNLYVVSCNESSYTLSNAGTYYAQIKGTDTFTITRPLTVTDDHFPLYQYPPIDGTTTGLTTSTTTATWTISGVQYSTGSSVAGSPYNTFDNSITSGFDSTSSTGDITITFESSKTIRKYIVWPYDSTSPVSTPGGNTDPTLSTDGTFRPKSWVLYGTNNPNEWLTVLDTVTNQPPSIYGDVHSISSPASYQYYKLSVTANNGGSGLKIGEWQLWGDA